MNGGRNHSNMSSGRDYIRIEKAAKARRTTANAVTYFLLAVWAVIVLFPFYWMLLTSVKSYSAYNAESIPKFFTLSPTLQNYADAFTAVPLGRYLLNTTIFTVVTTALMLAVITLAAFAFARLDFRGKNVLFVLFLSLMMIPTMIINLFNNALMFKLIKKYPKAWENGFFRMPKWFFNITIILAILCDLLISAALLTTLKSGDQYFILIMVAGLFAYSHYRLKAGKINLQDIERIRREAEEAAGASGGK